MRDTKSKPRPPSAMCVCQEESRWVYDVPSVTGWEEWRPWIEGHNWQGAVTACDWSCGLLQFPIQQETGTHSKATAEARTATRIPL